MLTFSSKWEPSIINRFSINNNNSSNSWRNSNKMLNINKIIIFIHWRMVILTKVRLLSIERIYLVWTIKIILVSMGHGRRVKQVREEFLMIVVSQWQFKFKIAKILNILMEVAFCLGVEKILKQAPTKTIICTLLQVLLLRSNLILIPGLI